MKKRLGRIITAMLLVSAMLFNSISSIVFAEQMKIVESENLALGKVTEASSSEVDKFGPEKATDGVTDRGSDVTKPGQSRWSSKLLNNGQNPQWITVDLGEVKTFNEVVVEWERNNITSYRIEVSKDKGSWTTVYESTNISALRDIISLEEEQEARYIRVNIFNNNPNSVVAWDNISIYEVEVYNGKSPETIDEVVSNLKVNISKDDKKLIIPEVPEGYEISFIGADYKQVIGDNLTIYTPLVDTSVIVDFEVKKGEEKKVTSGIEIVVPGRFNEAIGNNKKPTVIPELMEWAPSSGDFVIKDSSRIVISPKYENVLKETANIFAKDYKDIVGKDIEVVVSNESRAGDFHLRIGNTYPEIGDEGYFVNVSESIDIEANHPTGVYYATVSMLQILKQNGDRIPKGLIRDYPRYEVRGFMLDVARKPFSLEFLEEIVKTMSWYKMNDFQVHLNDNYIWLEEHENPYEAYSGFRLESEVHQDITSKDIYYTKEEFGEFIDISGKYGVNIVPEIDTPSHALSLTKVYPELASGHVGRKADHLDITNPKTYELVESIFDEYMDGENPTFRDSVVHIGTDEYFGHAEEFRAYTDYFLEYIKEKGSTPRLWGGLTWLPGETEVTSEGVQINIWSKDWADPSDMHALGFDMINTEDSQLYIVPSAGYYYDYLNIENLYNNWVPNEFANGDVIPAGNPQMIGGMFALWNDMIDKKANGIVEYDIFDRVLPAIQTLSEKLWGRAKDKSFEEFKVVANNVSTAPNTNPTFKVDSKTEKVMEYKLNQSITELKDTSGNDYNIIKTENVESVKGKDGKSISLKGGASYIESPVDNIGPNYTVSMNVKRDSTSGIEEQVLFESSKGSFKAIQKDTGKVGFSREGYDFSFNYELPSEEWVELTVVGMINKTQLYVNGEYVDEISKSGTNGKYHGTFVFPLKTIGSKTNSFKGLIDNIVVNNTKLISDKTIIPQEYMTITSTSEQTGGSEGPANLAIDGDESSIWHTKWSPSKDELPQSLTLNLGKEYTVNKFSYLPRQSGSNGNINSYDILTSTDGKNFTKVSEGTWENNMSLKKAEFEPVKATHIRFTAKSGVGGFASAAEVNVHQVIEDEDIVLSKINNLKSSEVTKNTVELVWDEPNSLVGLTEYVVYKDGKEFAKVPVGTTELVADGLRTNTNYGFKVTAKYSNDEESKPKSINVRTRK